MDWSGCSRLLREKASQGETPQAQEHRGRTARGKRVPEVESNVQILKNLKI
ncbi:hypothetical protein [Peribacillus frigoritolerans]|uniref:hypothetical protein n=1 Tax=Peribacillus frigoritolerans TaxID=450367 RepID=UPI0020C065C9|nr:hypothetical protein [Peribacillus frigoritolerans]